VYAVTCGRRSVGERKVVGVKLWGVREDDVLGLSYDRPS
jgi:hypothetical protein